MHGIICLIDASEIYLAFTSPGDYILYKGIVGLMDKVWQCLCDFESGSGATILYRLAGILYPNLNGTKYAQISLMYLIG